MENEDRPATREYDLQGLFELVKDTNSSYYRLEPEEYEASMGRDYVHLKEVMANWGFRLHTHGLNLPQDELETIFKYGLMTWYIDKITERTRIGLGLRSYVENVRDNEKRVNFYDFKKLMKVYHTLDESRPDIPEKMQVFCKHPNYQIFLKNSGWKYAAFHHHLMRERIMDTYLQFVQDVSESLDATGDLHMVRYIESNGQKITNIEILREMVWSEDIMRLGVVFQRLKVAVEKIGMTCQRFDKDTSFSPEQKEGIYIKLLFYDRFVTRAQELIYLLIRQAISVIHEIRDPIVDDNLELPIYRELLRWVRSSKKWCVPYNEIDLILKDPDTFLK